jgi:hypothetical protein
MVNRAIDRAARAIGRVGMALTGVSDAIEVGQAVERGDYAAAAGTLIMAAGTSSPAGKVLGNLKRTLKGAQGADVSVSAYGRGYRATWEVAGEGGGQSRTVWVKDINADGRTIRMYHDSYDRAGRYQHRKFKYPDEHQSF